MNDYPALSMTTSGDNGDDGDDVEVVNNDTGRRNDTRDSSDPSVTFDMFAAPTSNSKLYNQPYYPPTRHQHVPVKPIVPSQSSTTPTLRVFGADRGGEEEEEIVIPITINERHRNVTTESESTAVIATIHPNNTDINAATTDPNSNQRPKTINHGRSYNKKKGKYCCCSGSSNTTTTWSKPRLLLLIIMCLLGVWWATTTVSLLASLSDISLFAPKSISDRALAGGDILLPLPDTIIGHGLGVTAVVSKRELDHTTHTPPLPQKRPFVADYMTEFHHATFDKIVLDILLNEMSQPLNDYSWQLTIDISNATLRDKPLNRKVISSDHPSLVGAGVGPWEYRNLDLDNVFKRSVSNVLQVKLNVDSARGTNFVGNSQQRTTMGGKSTNKIYEKELKEIMDDSLVRTIYRLIYESLDYRCCCYAANSNIRAKCGKKSTESKDSFEKELELLEKQTIATITAKHTTAPLEDWIYCKVKWHSLGESNKQHSSSTNSDLVLQFGTSSKLMATLAKDDYRCSLQIMIEDSVRTKPTVPSFPPND